MVGQVAFRLIADTPHSTRTPHKLCLAPATDGRIWKGDLKTGQGEVVVPEVGSTAVGLAFDKRTEYLYVCGGPAGEKTSFFCIHSPPSWC